MTLTERVYQGIQWRAGFGLLLLMAVVVAVDSGEPLHVAVGIVMGMVAVGLYGDRA